MSGGIRARFYADIMAVHPEVTGSCMLVVVKYPDGSGNKFIVDCGLFQEREHSYYNYEFPFKPMELDFALVTHNHVDHTGRLPLLVKRGFYQTIYMTEQTSILIGPALEDCCRVLKSTSKRANCKELYTSADVGDALLKIKGCDFGKSIKITPNIQATFFMNGHLPGASLIHVRIKYKGEQDINLLFTGDYNKRNIFFNVRSVPKSIRNLPLTIIQESTYGDMDSTEVIKSYEGKVIDALKKGKTIINPSYSLGRVQEVLYTVKRMKETKKIPRDVPVYLDGKLAIRYTSIFTRGKLNLKESMKDFLPEDLIIVDKEMRQKILEDDTAKIIVTSSGSGSYGPAQTYIQQYLPKRNALILFTGYTPEGTLGSRLKNTPIGESVEVGGLIVLRRAEVDYTNEFSAHAKADEMIEFLNMFENPRLILINHGQTETKKSFAKRVLQGVEKAKNVGVLDRQYFFRVDGFGLIKTFGTKFE